MENRQRIYNVFLKGEPQVIAISFEQKKSAIGKQVGNNNHIKVSSQLVRAEHLQLITQHESVFYAFYLDGQMVAAFPMDTVSYVTSWEAFILEDLLESEGGAAE